MQNKRVTRYKWWIVESVKEVLCIRVYYVYVIDTVNLPSNLLYDILWLMSFSISFLWLLLLLRCFVSSFFLSFLIGKYSINLNQTLLYIIELCCCRMLV